MDLLTIHGGKRLSGTIPVSGSKNAGLPVMIASLLTDEPCIIDNVPHLDDIETLIALLVFLGKEISRYKDRLEIKSTPSLYAEAPYELVRRMRASIVVMGPLLARLGRVKVSLPGGCAIGGRPINIHLDGFKAMGADLKIEQGYVEMTAKALQGTAFHLDFASVGATENLMMAAALAKGRTTLINAAMEPEIEDLANCLISMGAQIKGIGTETITIDGVEKLHGFEHRVIPDRIEAGTYMIAAGITGGDLTLTGVIPEHMKTLIVKLEQAGVKVEAGDGRIAVYASRSIKPVNIETAVYPGFPTDLQAQWVALMTRAEGDSSVTERVFENRFMHIAELQRMGAEIQIRGNTATVVGGGTLSGADVMVSDLRAGAALVLAGLAASGETNIHRIYHLDRGYEHLEEKLSAVGAEITRSKE
jgi:UDP-N-acetylglucosamine 1-carboxyvinyltransferase